MGWKNWSYWLKGGIILLCLEIIRELFLIIPNSLINNIADTLILIINPFFIILTLIYNNFSIYAFPFVFGINIFDNSFYRLIYIILSFILIFIWGAIIGLIYGKIKNRNKKRK